MVSSVYNYYLSQYGHNINSKNDLHKKSELKNTYNRMLKINKFTPLYKVDVSEAAQKYAIDLKENARELSNIANELSSDNDDEIIYKKYVQSSNPDAVEINYVGDNTNPPVNSFDMDVYQLAQSQVNTGNFLQPNGNHIKEGDYSFDLNIADLTYEFQFSVEEDSTNKDIQDRISRLINRSNIGLKASVLSDSLGNTAISIESDATGIANMKSVIFDFEPNESSNLSDNSSNNNLVDSLGLNRVVTYPANAIFAVDGNRRVSTTNTFTINNAFDVTLKSPTDENSPVTVSLKDDGSAIIDSITDLIDKYNKLISVTDNEENNQFSGNKKLQHEFIALTKTYNNLLQPGGLSVADDGTIQVDNAELAKAADEGRLADVYKSLGKFKNALQGKAENIALNPMNYVNNKIVAYKHPQKSLNDPYNSSAYSGMMFSGYI